MGRKTRIGILICHRYHTCAGGKCLRALHRREGAFAAYAGTEVELAAYATCGGCPGGNVEYAPAEMKRNGVEVVHLATGLVVGYPPCPRITYFRDYIRQAFGLKVVVGTHPIPEKYHRRHQELGTWAGPAWEELLRPTLATEEVRCAYD